MKTNKKFALLAVTLTLSASAQANLWKDMLEKFDSLNKEEKTECAKMDNHEVAALCVEEVCGDASKNPIIINAETIQRYDIEKSKKLVADTEEQLKKRQATIENNVKNAMEAIQILKNIKDPTQLSDVVAENIIELIIDNITNDHKVLQKINPFKLNEKRVNLVVPPTSPYQQIYKDVLSKIDLGKHPSLLLVAGAKESEGHYQIYEEKAALFQQELAARNAKSNYPFKKFRKELEASKKSKQNNAIGSYYIPLKKAARDAGIELEPTLCDENCKKGIISYFQKAEFFNPQELIKKEQEKFAFADAMAECSASALLNHVEAKSSEEIEKEWPKLIQRLEDDKRLKFSAHSKGLILEKIKNDLNVKFNVPFKMTPDLFKTKSVTFSIFEQDDDISAAYQSIGSASAKKYFEKSVKTPRCVAIKKSISISDHVAFKKEENKADLVVSPFSCEHVHIGKSIMAHELGHAVSYFIAYTPGMSTETKDGFKKLRECSRQEKRSTKFPGLSPHEGDKWTTEEDTADLFSHALSDDNDTLMSCSLTAPDGEKYTGLRMKKGFFDTHSAGIQRLMIELQYKNPGKITEACKEVIKRSKAKITNLCL